MYLLASFFNKLKQVAKMAKIFHIDATKVNLIYRITMWRFPSIRVFLLCIMIAQCQHINNIFNFIDGINNTVFIIYSARPFSGKFIFQFFRFSNTGIWVFLDVCQQSRYALHYCRITAFLPKFSIFFGLRCKL